jgi:hypothetical protein
MAEGKHRHTWDGHTAAVVCVQSGKLIPYETGERDSPEGDDITTGDRDADWELAANLMAGAEIR